MFFADLKLQQPQSCFAARVVSYSINVNPSFSSHPILPTSFLEDRDDLYDTIKISEAKSLPQSFAGIIFHTRTHVIAVERASVDIRWCNGGEPEGKSPLKTRKVADTTVEREDVNMPASHVLKTKKNFFLSDSLAGSPPTPSQFCKLL